MTRNADKKNGTSHLFSIELVSRDHLKCLILPIKNDAKVLIEGFLGDIEEIGIIEGLMLEINGSKGTLKMDLSEEEISKLLQENPGK
jgi:hypothetical protein